MMNTREELYEKAKNTYIKIFERTAHRYFNNEIYTVCDRVGYECTALEDIFRPLWGIAPFLKDEDFAIDTVRGRMNISEFIITVVKEGMCKRSPRCFDKNVNEAGRITFANQSVTEIAGYLVAVRFAKEELWDSIPEDVRAEVAEFIRKWSVEAIQNSWQNNHYWYPVFCIEILKWLGFDMSECDADLGRGYDFLEGLYYGNGWYSDGELGRFDFYEAWAHHTYTLLWILIADKNSENYANKAENYRRRSEEYLKYFINYFDSDGSMSAYGRSICYRFAAIAPFGLAALADCKIDLGLAKNVILKNVDYFYRESIPYYAGCFPVGYLYATERFGDSYISDGAISCYTEGFMCLLADEEHPLWQASAKPLPIECGNYILPCPLDEVKIAIEGNASSGVTLFNGYIHYYQDARFSHKFNDMAGSYSKFAYNSRAGYSLSSADLVSYDNMISLSTADGVMYSHRRKILDPRVIDGVYYSRHYPFSNDSDTYIDTALIPLTDGYHVRAHKVVLGRSYAVSEGGFTLSVRKDGCLRTSGKVSEGERVSKISVISDVKTSLAYEQSPSGMHIHSPLAFYPVYRTKPLDKGEYYFVSTVYFSTEGEIDKAPEIRIEEKRIFVSYGDKAKVIEL